jgi:hypothetical protein
MGLEDVVRPSVDLVESLKRSPRRQSAGQAQMQSLSEHLLQLF